MLSLLDNKDLIARLKMQKLTDTERLLIERLEDANSKKISDDVLLGSLQDIEEQLPAEDFLADVMISINELIDSKPKKAELIQALNDLCNELDNIAQCQFNATSFAHSVVKELNSKIRN